MKQLPKFFGKKLLKNSYFFKAHLKRVIEEETFDRNLQIQKQSELLVQLINKAYNHSAFYRKLYDLHGLKINDIKDVRDISKLPIIEKKDIRSSVEDIRIGHPLLMTKGYTSGTSGSPLMVYRNYLSVIKEEAYIWRQRIKFGHTLGSRAVSLRGDLSRTKFKAFDPFTNTLFLSSFMLNADNLNRYYETIRSFKPNAIYAYPSSVETLANFLINHKKRLEVPLVFTSSETLYDFQRVKIESAFNTKVVDWYGNAERTIALEENTAGLYNDIPLYSYNEYYENFTVTTGLLNFNFPLIRYKVDDIIDVGSQAGIVNKILGRTDDVVILPDSTRIGRLGGAFKGIDQIQYAQIIQNETSSLLVNIVPGIGFNNETISKIKSNIVKKVGSEIKIRFQIIKEDKLIKSKRGKYKLVINELEKS